MVPDHWKDTDIRKINRAADLIDEHLATHDSIRTVRAVLDKTREEAHRDASGGLRPHWVDAYNVYVENIFRTAQAFEKAERLEKDNQTLRVSGKLVDTMRRTSELDYERAVTRLREYRNANPIHTTKVDLLSEISALKAENKGLKEMVATIAATGLRMAMDSETLDMFNQACEKAGLDAEILDLRDQTSDG